MCPPPNLTRTSPAAHPRSEMTYSFAVGVLPCAFACALLCVHASVDVYTQAKCVCTLEYAQGIHISLCRSSVAYTQLFLHVYLHMHKEYTPVVRCVYSICGRTFVFIYASNQVKIMLFFGCVYSFHPQNSLVLSFYPQNFSSFATNPPNIHIHGMSIHYGIEIYQTTPLLPGIPHRGSTHACRKVPDNLRPRASGKASRPVGPSSPGSA